jgi:hypothetical protein
LAGFGGTLVKILSIVTLLAALFVVAARAEAATLYGATASGSAGNLYILDAATGSVLQHIGPLNDATGTNYPITGLAFHPLTNVLYGSTGNNPQATAGRLVTIDPQTALVTVVGLYNAGPVNSSGTPSTMADLAFDATGNLYGVGSIGGPQLYSINTATAQATVIGSTGLTSTSGGGLAIGPDGTFYGTPTASRYGTYDSMSGAYTNITNPVKPGGGGAYAALAFDDNGILYGMNSAPGSPPPSYLVTIDPTSGAVMNVGQIMDGGQPVSSFDAIAFQPDVVIPEPATLVLMIGTAVGALLRRRRGRA